MQMQTHLGAHSHVQRDPLALVQPEDQHGGAGVCSTRVTLILLRSRSALTATTR